MRSRLSHQDHRRIVNALRKTWLGRDLSDRLLEDFAIAIAANKSDERPEPIEAPQGLESDETAAILVVLSGDLEVRYAGSRRKPWVIPAGAAWIEKDLANAVLKVRSAFARPARYFRAERNEIDAVVTDSWELATTMRAPVVEPHERIWLTEEPGLGAPLEALSSLLASAIGQQFGETVQTGTARLSETGIDFAMCDRAGDIQRADGAALRRAIYFNPTKPHEISKAAEPAGKLTFDRIVYLTKTMPAAIPEAFAGRLKGRTVHDDPRYGRFIATILPGGPKGSPEPITLLPTNAPVDSRDRTVARLARDSCRLRLDLGYLRSRWQRSNPDERRAFPNATFGEAIDQKESIWRWARAVTLRRVGIALSGGGASSYRLVAMIERLHRKNVPIDIVSGVSGGALLGAYYCARGRAGLQMLIERGPQYMAWALVALFCSRVMRWQVDYDLSCACIDETELRFVPVATRSGGKTPPTPVTFQAGTFGNAVLKSGSAPIFYSPVEDGTGRYVDGSTSAPIPAQACREYGADLLFAFNSIPGPGAGNPLADYLPGRLVYRWTPVGRVIDYVVGFSFLLQQASRECGEDADVFFEPDPDRIPFLEAFQFIAAKSVVEDADNDPDIEAKAEECAVRWNAFKHGESRQ